MLSADGHGRPTVPCATASAAADESLAGTAPAATTWLVVEQHGAYGRQALLESGLPPTVGAFLSAPAWEGAKVILGRPPGRHAEPRPGHGTTVWCAHAPTGRAVSTTLTDARQLLDLDPASCVAGNLPEWPPAEPRFFVCTNGKRDACCARLGRAALSGVADPAVWECSHLGGHRFAATGVLLPWGYVYGRLTAADITAVLDDARRGAVHLSHLRGRSSLRPAAQVADVFLRTQRQLTGPEDVMVVAERQRSAGVIRVTLRAPNGIEVDVDVAKRGGAAAVVSCGAIPQQQHQLEVVASHSPAGGP